MKQLLGVHAVISISIAVAGFAPSAPAQEPRTDLDIRNFAPAQAHQSSVSPDKKWEYRCVDGVWSSIVDTDTHETVLDLSNEVAAPYCRQAEVIWAPDSKRFAFNYSPPHVAHSSYETIALYQLRGDKWLALRLPVDESSERAQLAQLAKEHLPKSAYPAKAELVRDILKVRSWADANTAILYADSVWLGNGSRSSEASFLFTLKFDAEGKSKIVKTHRMSAKEIENESKGQKAAAH